MIQAPPGPLRARKNLTRFLVEARLGEDGGKPTGMHWRTYYRILDQLRI
jgi:hypothetical protein